MARACETGGVREQLHQKPAKLTEATKEGRPACQAPAAPLAKPARARPDGNLGFNANMPRSNEHENVLMMMLGEGFPVI